MVDLYVGLMEQVLRLIKQINNLDKGNSNTLQTSGQAAGKIKSQQYRSCIEPRYKLKRKETWCFYFCKHHTRNKMNGFNLLYRWIRLAQSGITIEKLLLDRNIRSVAIYGFNRIAECMLYELRESNVQVQAIIDKKGDGILIDYTAYKPDEIGELEVDAVIMMPVDDYGDIKSKLLEYTRVDIISIEEILYEL